MREVRYNMAAGRETLADIIRDKRELAARIRVNLSNVPARREDQLLEASSLERDANRLDAAWKRDEERAVEHATRHAESVARDNCRDCVCREARDDLRTALMVIIDAMDAVGFKPWCANDPLEVAYSAAKAALEKHAGGARVWCKRDQTRHCVDCEMCKGELEGREREHRETA